jgi:hypothetical protein
MDGARGIIAKNLYLTDSRLGAQSYLVIDGVDRNRCNLDQKVPPLGMRYWQVQVDQSFWIA